MASNFRWENIYDETCMETGHYDETKRMPVPGGWLIRSTYRNIYAVIASQSMVFIRDPDHKWFLGEPFKSQRNQEIWATLHEKTNQEVSE